MKPLRIGLIFFALIFVCVDPISVSALAAADIEAGCFGLRVRLFLETMAKGYRVPAEVRQRLRETYGTAPKDPTLQFGYFKAEIDEFRAEHPEVKEMYDEEIYAIILYQGREYRKINDPLRGADWDALSKQTDLISTLASALNQRPEYRGEVARYVTGGISAADLVHYVDGNIITFLPFTSASVGSVEKLNQNFQVAMGPDTTFFSIKAKSARDIRLFEYDDEDFGAEREVIFLPGTKFRVVGSIKSIPNPIAGLSGTVSLITLEEL